MSHEQTQLDSQYEPSQGDMYRSYLNDERASGDLLKIIQIQNYNALHEAGTVLHFIDSMHDEEMYDPNARLVVAQSWRTSSEGDRYRVLQLRLHQDRDSQQQNNLRDVAEEYSGMVLPIAPFTEQDANVVAGQLADLQEMKDRGMLTLDSSLSEIPQTSKLIREGF